MIVEFLFVILHTTLASQEFGPNVLIQSSVSFDAFVLYFAS